MHLVEGIARMRIVPAEADTPAKLVDDPEILTRIARWLDGLASELDHAVGVRHRADFPATP